MGFGGKDDHREPPGELGETGDPTAREEIGELLVDNLGFVDAVAWWTASDWFGVAGVDAKFIVEDGAADAVRSKRVPVFVDDGRETGFVVGVEGGWEGNELVKVSLVLGGVPKDAVGARDGKVEGVCGWAEKGGTAIRGEEVEIFVDVVVSGGKVLVAVRWFGSPDFGRNVNEKGGGG